MDIVFKAPTLLLYVCIGVFVVALLSVLLKKGETWKRILTMGIVVVVCGAILLFFYRDKHLVVDEAGMHGNPYGQVSLEWGAVTKAVLVEDLGSSPYALRMRTNGVAVGSYRMGWFSLANGQKGFVFAEIPARALVLETSGLTYVLAPKQLDEMVAIAETHVTVTKGE
jgi:hypothetical protein